MSFFESEDWADDSRRQSKPRRFVGFGFLLVFTAGLLAAAFLPTPYVIEGPGPTFNVLGETEGKPVIAVSGAKTFETDGNLDVLTVSLFGSREQTPSWIEIALAWMDPAKIVVPLDQAFPTGQTDEEVRAESTAMMEESQQDAIEQPWLISAMKCRAMSMSAKCRPALQRAEKLRPQISSSP